MRFPSALPFSSEFESDGSWYVGDMRLFALVLMLSAVVAVAAPAPPASTSISTNTPFTDRTILTNVAVAMPVGTWANATVYAPAKSVTQGIQFVWSPSAGASGYALYYGDVTGTTSNRFDVLTCQSAVFFGLDKSTTYYFYVVAYDASKAESQPSPVVLFKPGT